MVIGETKLQGDVDAVILYTLRAMTCRWPGLYSSGYQPFSQQYHLKTVDVLEKRIKWYFCPSIGPCTSDCWIILRRLFEFAQFENQWFDVDCGLDRELELLWWLQVHKENLYSWWTTLARSTKTTSYWQHLSQIFAHFDRWHQTSKKWWKHSFFTGLKHHDNEKHGKIVPSA